MVRSRRNRLSRRLKGKLSLLKNHERSNTHAATKVTVTNVSTSTLPSTSKLRHSAVDETQCSKVCTDCLWLLRGSSYCLNIGKKIYAPGVGNEAITRRPLDNEVTIAPSEAFPLLETLTWSRGLGLRVLWNISSRKLITKPDDVAEWIRHHCRKAKFSKKLRGPYYVTAGKKLAPSLAGHLIEILAIFGLVICGVRKVERRTSPSKKMRQRLTWLPGIIPKIKSITIIFNKDPSAMLHSVATYNETYEWLRQITSDWKPLTLNMLDEQKDNVKIVFPSLRSVETIEDKVSWQTDPEVDMVISMADWNYRSATACKRNAIRLWKESSALSSNEKAERRKMALSELAKAIGFYGQDPMSCPFLHSKGAKWEGILLSQEGKWEEARIRFESGLTFAKTYITPEIDWFEAAVKETEGWIKLKNVFVSGSNVGSVSDAVKDFEEATHLYEKAKDSTSRSFVEYWIELFKSFGTQILPDHALLKRIDEYTQRDSPRAKERRTMIDRQITFKALRPLLSYFVFAQMAQVLEIRLNEIFKKYINHPKSWPLESLIKLSRAIVEPSPSIEWLVANNTKRKHETETKAKQEQHIIQVAGDSGQLERMPESIDEYLGMVEQKLKETSKIN